MQTRVPKPCILSSPSPSNLLHFHALPLLISTAHPSDHYFLQYQDAQSWYCLRVITWTMLRSAIHLWVGQVVLLFTKILSLVYRYQYIIMVMAEANTTWLSHTNISRNFEPWSSTLTILNFRELRISSRYTSSYPQLLDLTQLHTTFFFFKVCIKRQCKMPKHALI